MSAHRFVVATCFALAAFLGGQFTAANAQIDEPVILVATPELRDELFSATVLIVTPIGNRQHIGFILNRPTSVRLSEMFPDHAPSKKVAEPIFLGGPESAQVLFALVRRHGDGDGTRFRVADDLYLEIETAKVDHIIENEHGGARFFAGIVVWQPGELEAEIRGNYWYVQEADAQLVLRKSTAGMWKDLAERLARGRNAI